jgi:tungstate transport system substrate-binding protein
MRLLRLGRPAALLLGLLAPLTLPACGESDPGGAPRLDRPDPKLPRVRLATTTSARDTGLLEFLKPEIRRVAKAELIDVAVGTGQALELAKRGDADFVIVHDRAKEDAFVKDGWGIDRRDLMWNDFILLGPASDPAGVKGATDAAASLRRIADAKAGFISRGDDSGTHSREKSLWKKAGGRPDWPEYAEAGQGQGPTLLMADEKRAYALSDRGTYASMKKKLGLTILVEGDPALRNPYGLIRVNPDKVKGASADLAKAVADYLLSPEGQAKIAAFQVEGVTLFHPGAPKD